MDGLVPAEMSQRGASHPRGSKGCEAFRLLPDERISFLQDPVLLTNVLISIDDDLLQPVLPGFRRSTQRRHEGDVAITRGTQDEDVL